MTEFDPAFVAAMRARGVELPEFIKEPDKPIRSTPEIEELPAHTIESEAIADGTAYGEPAEREAEQLEREQNESLDDFPLIRDAGEVLNGPINGEENYSLRIDDPTDPANPYYKTPEQRAKEDVMARYLKENYGTPEQPRQQETPRLIQSSAEFIQDFECPDPLIEGILMRRFIYALTGHVAKGKTAIALLCAAHVGLGRMLGNLEVEQGRVLYLAGENYVDAQMRWIAMAEQMDFDPKTIPVHFRPGRFKLSENMEQVRREADELGGFDLVIVDGSTAFYEGDDENSNTQSAEHAVRLRELTTLKGNPCVVVLCHPTKNCADDCLQPRGGGALIAEWDGNLTATKNGSVTTIHWYLKIRGPDFAPVTFLLRTVTHERLKSKKGKLMPTVIAEPLSQTREEEMNIVAANEETALMQAVSDNPRLKQAELARHLGWLNRNGEPLKMKVNRLVKELAKQKLMKQNRSGSLALTDKGKQELKEQGNG